jgi:hypothetical protein
MYLVHLSYDIPSDIIREQQKNLQLYGWWLIESQVDLIWSMVLVRRFVVGGV